MLISRHDVCCWILTRLKKTKEKGKEKERRKKKKKRKEGKKKEEKKGGGRRKGRERGRERKGGGGGVAKEKDEKEEFWSILKKLCGRLCSIRITVEMQIACFCLEGRHHEAAPIVCSHRRVIELLTFCT